MVNANCIYRTLITVGQYKYTHSVFRGRFVIYNNQTNGYNIYSEYIVFYILRKLLRDEHNNRKICEIHVTIRHVF